MLYRRHRLNFGSVYAMQGKFGDPFRLCMSIFGVRLRSTGTICSSVYAMQVKFGVCLRSMGEIWGLPTQCRWIFLGSVYALQVKFPGPFRLCRSVFGSVCALQVPQAFVLEQELGEWRYVVGFFFSCSDGYRNSSWPDTRLLGAQSLLILIWIFLFLTDSGFAFGFSLLCTLYIILYLYYTYTYTYT